MATAVKVCSACGRFHTKTTYFRCLDCGGMLTKEIPGPVEQETPGREPTDPETTAEMLERLTDALAEIQTGLRWFDSLADDEIWGALYRAADELHDAIELIREGLKDE